jgi:hypothetical protein
MQSSLRSGALGATRPAAATLPRVSRPALPARVGRTDGVRARALAPMETVRLASQVATSLSLAVGAWWFYNQEMMLEQVRRRGGPAPAGLRQKRSFAFLLAAARAQPR